MVTKSSFRSSLPLSSIGWPKQRNSMVTGFPSRSVPETETLHSYLSYGLHFLTGTPFSVVIQLGSIYCASAFGESDRDTLKKVPEERMMAARTAARDFLLSFVFRVC